MPQSTNIALECEDSAASDQASVYRQLKAWSKVLGCFMIYFNPWGVAASFGVYQSYYQTNTLSETSPSVISWIGTIQVFLLFFTAIVAGPLFDRGITKALLYIGCALIFIGFLALSFADQLWQILLSQSICIGIGSGLVFVPAVAIVASNFNAWQPIAMGIASTGSAIGGTVLPVLFQALISKVGLSWTNRIFSFITLAISATAISTLCCEPSTAARSRQSMTKFFDFSAFRDPSYIFLCVGLFLIELGFWIPGFLIAPYAQTSLGSSSQYAFYLLAILNAGSFAGRILPAFVAQMPKVGPAWTLVAGSASLGLLVFCWIAIHDVVAITVWAVLVGFMSGITVSIPNTVVSKLSVVSNLGTRSGMLWTIAAFAALIGSPIAGILVDTENGSYKWGQIFSGANICAGSVLLCVPASRIKQGVHRE